MQRITLKISFIIIEQKILVIHKIFYPYRSHYLIRAVQIKFLKIKAFR